MLKKTTPNNNLPYQKEYEEAQFFVVKSRLRLFCFLTLILYISASIVSLVQNPQAFKKIEIASWVFLTTAACVALYANTRVKTLLKAKINAFIFSGLLVLCVLGLFLLYKEYIPTSESIFSITLFAISFIIPWGRFAVFAMGLCHLLAYAFLYIWSNLVIHKGVYAPFTTNEFIDGLTYLVIALVICLVIKKNDRDMAKKNFILMKNLQKKNEQMERELELAREVHKTLIPQSTTTDNAVIAVNYVPVSTVGGDYASFHVTAEGNLFFLIGDITGHGVPAALMVNRIYGETESLMSKGLMPGGLLRELDGFVQQHFSRTEMFFSVCSGLLDFKRKALYYSNYGHPPQILHQRQRNTIHLLKSQTHLLGIEAGQDPKAVFEGTLSFDNKDRIILFTDGLIETMGQDKELYGMQRLEGFARNHISDHPALFNTNLLKEVNEFRIGPVTDDIFLLVIDIK